MSDDCPDDCGCCIDGRYIGAVCEYASSCDGCGELTMHEAMWADEPTQLGYCEKCAPEAQRRAEMRDAPAAEEPSHE